MITVMITINDNDNDNNVAVSILFYCQRQCTTKFPSPAQKKFCRAMLTAKNNSKMCFVEPWGQLKTPQKCVL